MLSSSVVSQVIFWIVGVLLLLIGLAVLLVGGYLTAISIILASLISIPNTFSNINRLTKNRIESNNLRVISIIVLVVLGVVFVPPTDSTSQTPQAQEMSKEQNQPVPEGESVGKYAEDQQLIEEEIYVDEPDVFDENTGTVVSVTDGDTLRVNVNGEEMNIRLIGINTPELHHQSEPIQCFAPEAQQALQNLVLNKEVTLEKDVSDKDKYGRYLRYIWSGETLINEYMTENGYAFSSAYPPDTKYQDRITQGEQIAKNTDKGLWSSETCGGDVYTGTYKDPKLKISENTGIEETPTQVNKTNEVKKAPAVAPTQASKYTCNCSKACGKMASCEEAYFQLNECGCSARDGNDDGVPCQSICR